MAAVTSVFRAQQIYLARIDAVLRPLGLTFARYEVLMLLMFSRAGSLPLSKVGARLQVHPTSVTNAVNRLEEQGLISRVPHPTDRRTTLAEITPRAAAWPRGRHGRRQHGRSSSEPGTGRGRGGVTGRRGPAPFATRPATSRPGRSGPLRPLAGTAAPERAQGVRAPHVPTGAGRPSVDQGRHVGAAAGRGRGRRRSGADQVVVQVDHGRARRTGRPG